MYRAGTALLALFVFVGCHGEAVEAAVDGDAGRDSREADAGVDAPGEAGACAPVPGNLIENPSFELTNSAGLLTGWLGDPIGSIVQRTGGAAHCGHWAELETPESPGVVFYWGQEMVLGTAPAKGTKFLATAWVRTLDAQNANLRIVTGIPSGNNNYAEFTVPADGSWKLAAVEWTVPVDGETRFFVDIGSGANPRKIGVDQFTFVEQR